MVRKSPSSRKKLTQSTLTFSSSNSLTKCTKCLMTYNASSPGDITQHKKYHDLHLNGRRWHSTWGDIVSRMGVESSCDNHATPSSSDTKSHCLQTLLKRNDTNRIMSHQEEYIVMISPKKPNEVKSTLELMEIVNDELNAPHDENGFWSQTNGWEGSRGKAFVYVKNGKAVGVITVEDLTYTARGRWMIVESRDVVTTAIPDVKIGISRIWVCRNERGRGVATKLLECARKKTVYGSILEKWELAWSQPSDSGAKLATSYNSVKHSSGKLLIPCYI